MKITIEEKRKKKSATFIINNANFDTYYEALKVNANVDPFNKPNLSCATEQDVLKWAREKEILFKENISKQLIKFKEEADELIEATLNYIEDDTTENKKAARLEHGDVQVTLALLANMLNSTNGQCFEMAYNKIKNRKGKTINGTFVKEQDLK